MSKVWQVAQWMLKHSAQVPAILAAGEAIGEADTLAEKWPPIKQVGDIVVPILGDFPDLSGDASIMEAAVAMALEQQVTAAGFDFGKLLAAAERLAVMIPLLLELFKKMATQSTVHHAS